MRMTAVSFGSRGDVEPFLTLTHALAAAGHRVRLLTHPEYARATSGDVELMPTRGRSPQELIDTDAGRWALSARNPLVALRRIARVLAPELRLIYEDCLHAIADADAVLAFPATFPALDVAHHLGRPVVHVHHVPLVPTAAHPVPGPYVKLRTLTPVGNRASYRLDSWLLWRLTRDAARDARRAVLGDGADAVSERQVLAARRRRAGAVVGVSPSVMRPPADWPADAVMCGYWWPSETAPATAALPPATASFLTAGEPPVFVSLGSTPVTDPAALTALITGAASDAGVRLVLQSGWSGLGAGITDSRVHVLGDIAYAAIFPEVAAVVHHGGAGTTALGLRYGRPTLCLPSVADQFFWGYRVATAGAGPRPLPLTRLRRDRLAERLRLLVRRPGFAARSAQIAEGLAREDAGAAAVAAVEQFLSV